ncbi:MAG TPA: ABC transporter permease [Chloroflexota bacterium]|jgi:peptide/nickel transport system permease protein
MLTFITRRLLQSALILWGLSIVFFFLLHETPGGPCAALQQAGAGQAAFHKYQACAVRYHLNESVPQQYWGWLTATLHLDLGIGNDGTPVLDTILNRAPATLLLTGISYFVAELIGLPLGIFAALRRYSFFDSFFTILSYVGISMPSFWLAAVFITFFAVQLGWLPSGKIVQDVSNIPAFNGAGYWAYVAHHPWHAFTDFGTSLILPASVLAILTIAGDSRFMRASMLEVINQDYIRTARAKGLSRRTVVLKHALRNALMPIITNIALALPQLIGGAIITETIFAWPGMGQLFSNALSNSDYPTLQALLMLSAVGVLVGNLAGDLVYAWVDPRIRYD